MRGKILTEAMEIINGARQDSYGRPEDAFQTIAHYWNNYLTKFEGSVMDIKPKDVALLMVLFKIARAQHKGYNKDDYIDCCGYMALAHDLAEDDNA